jgi:LEA14-like dessication related protein
VNIEVPAVSQATFTLFCSYKYINMKKLFSIIAVSQFFLFTLSSCGSLKAPDFKGMENVRVGRLGANESSLNIDLHYFNPNKSKLKLKKAEGDAWIDDNLLGHFSIDTLIQIPANADFRMPVLLEMNMKKLLKNSAALLLKSEVTLRVEGKAKVGKGGIYINYPIHYEGKQRTDSLMKLVNNLK